MDQVLRLLAHKEREAEVVRTEIEALRTVIELLEQPHEARAFENERSVPELKRVSMPVSWP